MIVGARLVRDRRRSMLWWAFGLLVLVAFTAGLYPSISQEGDFDSVIRNLPESVKVMVGYDAAFPVTSPAGYLHGRLFALLAPIVVIVFAISGGSDAIGGSEEAGTLEPLLANPVTRTRVFLERYAVTAALLAAIVFVFGIWVFVVATPFGALEGVALSRLAGACAAMFALALLHGGIAFAVGAATGRRGPAIAVATVVAVGGYLAQSLGVLSDSLSWLRLLTPWHPYLDRNPLGYGAPVTAFVVPLVATVVIVLAGHAVFVRRDLH